MDSFTQRQNFLGIPIMNTGVCRIARAVKDQIGPPFRRLADEFFPRHLSVALIDVVFTPTLRYEEVVVPIVERYCKFCGISRSRADELCLPPWDYQETLRDCIGHYSQHGVKFMADKVYESRHCSPGTNILKAETVYKAAVCLRDIGVNVLQDMARTPQEAIGNALRPIRGIGHATIQMFLMYGGRSELVKGDVHICRFVARALCKKTVSPKEAEELVQQAAPLVDLKPRHLDYVIWKFQRDKQRSSPAKKSRSKGSSSCSR